MCFSFAFRKERDTAAQIANTAKADPFRGQKRKRRGRGVGGGGDGEKTKLFAVCFSCHSSPSFFSFCPLRPAIRRFFFFNLKGMKERLIAGYLLYETDETLLKNTPKNLLRKLAGVLYLLRTSDVSN